MKAIPHAAADQQPGNHMHCARTSIFADDEAMCLIAAVVSSSAFGIYTYASAIVSAIYAMAGHTWVHARGGALQRSCRWIMPAPPCWPGHLWRPVAAGYCLPWQSGQKRSSTARANGSQLMLKWFESSNHQGIQCLPAQSQRRACQDLNA